MAQAAALLLLVFGWLPIANWIPGGHDAPWYGSRLGEWLSGGTIVVGVGILVAMAVRRWPALWREGAWSRLAQQWKMSNRRGDAAIAFVSALVCALVAREIFSAKPLFIDEIIQVFQAQILTSGHLWLPSPHFPEFSSAQLLLDWDGKVYGQFPVGGPAMLALGVLVHAAWLVGPVATGVGVYWFARLLRRVEGEDGTALAAVLLYAFAPFTVFLGGSMMNHVTTTTWLLGAALALACAVDPERSNGSARVAADPSPAAQDTRSARYAFLMGLALGVAATIRPTDAAAFALPAAGWLLWRARLGKAQVRALLWSGVGVALPMAVMFYVNAQQTGSPLRFGYIAMWGTSHEIGFHAAPWGPAHTPARGLELVNLYFLRLQDYLFEAAGPSLAFATLALGLTRRVRAFDRWVLVASGLVVLSYFAYWHDGFYLGPRFMLPLAPWLAWWTARLPAVLRTRQAAAPLIRGTVAAGVAALLLGAATGIPIRARQYSNADVSRHIDVDSAAAAAGVQNALVLVREWWGGQLVAEMWAMGVSRVNAEHYYRWNDACRLQSAIDATEADSSGPAGLARHLAVFHDDSEHLVTNHVRADTSVRVVPGSLLDEKCLRRMAEDSAGFTTYTPLLLVHGHGNRYMRDLHARDSVLHPFTAGNPVWLLTQAPAVGAPLHFERVSADSARHDWDIQ